MQREILNATEHVKSISKKQATFARIYSIMKKTNKNLRENELENVTGNMVDKTIIEIIIVTNFTPFLILLAILSWLNKRKTLMKMLHKHPPKEVTDKDITETCDIATKFKLFKEFQVSVEKKLLELEAAIVSGCNEQFPPQNNISGNWQDN